MDFVLVLLLTRLSLVSWNSIDMSENQLLSEYQVTRSGGPQGEMVEEKEEEGFKNSPPDF